MSNLNSIDLNFCAIVNLKNFVLTAYPLYLILGVPLKTIGGIMYEKKCYFKFQGHNFEQWFLTLSLALKNMESNYEDFTESIIKEKDFEYCCSVDKKEKHLNVILKQSGIVDLCFSFDISELKLFLLAFADLLMYVYCLPDNSMEIFYHIVSHFSSFKEWNPTKGEEVIKKLKYSDVKKLCKTSCMKYSIEGSLFNFTDTMLRHKTNLLIVYLIKKNVSDNK
jgi:hypothetical protein